MDSIVNFIVDFKDTVIHKFGTVLGTVVLVVCAVVALSIIVFPLKTFLGIAIGLIIAAAVILGIYKLTEFFKKKRS